VSYCPPGSRSASKIPLPRLGTVCSPLTIGKDGDRYDEKGWRATFYTSGMEHSPASAIGTALAQNTTRVK
jgi:hypothetical protein